MTWVRLDDQFAFHPKVLEAGPDASWLFVAGLCWCAQHLTDGRIPKAAVPTLAAVKRTSSKRLVDAGLWHDEGDHYQVHDYLEFQPSKEKVEAEREAARKRQEKFRQGRRGSNGVTSGVTSHSPTPTPVPSGGSTSDDDSPLDRSSSWTDAELYAEAGRICARDFTGTFRTTFDDYATGAAKAIRREKRHLVDSLRRFPLEQAAEIISRPDAETIVEIDTAFDRDFVPADSITAGEAQ